MAALSAGTWTVKYGNWIDCTTTGSLTTKWIKYPSSGTTSCWDDEVHVVERIPAKLPAGARTLELPDGAKLIVDDAGNYRIEDQDAKVTYRANRIRDFSPHLNASDMVAAFVRYVGTLGVRQREVLSLPIELFINWLIIEAAERDKDPLPADIVPIAQSKQLQLAVRPKCLTCGRFIPRSHYEKQFLFCGLDHGLRYVQAHVPQLTTAV